MLFGTLKHPKGPSLNKLESFTVQLSGTLLSFSLPRSNNFRVPQRLPHKEVNLYDAERFEALADVPGRAPIAGCMTRWWDFSGLPIVHGRVCTIHFYMAAVRFDGFPTLFRPLHFQKAIERYVFTNQGPAAKKFDYTCRSHWRLDPLPSGVWAHYDNVSKRTGSHIFSNWHLPLTDSHMLVAVFEQTNNSRSKPKQTFDALAETVMSSIRVDYSPDALSQKGEAEKQFPGESLAENLPTLEWDAEPVERTFALRRRIFYQFNPENEVYELPNGERDVERHKKDSENISNEVVRVQQQQQQALDEAIQRGLASHLDFGP